MNPYLLTSVILLALGTIGVLTRRNPLVMFMSIEMMWNSANLVFVTFARQLHSMGGQVFVLLELAVAAAEVAVGLGIIVLVFRHRHQVDADQINSLKG